MIDNVRKSAVVPIATVVAGKADGRGPATTTKRATESAPASASLPRLLSLVDDLVRSGPPVDYARVAQVRRAIADGGYRVDTDALAKAIVAFARKN